MIAEGETGFAVPTRDSAALARQVGDLYERLLAEKGSI